MTKVVPVFLGEGTLFLVLTLEGGVGCFGVFEGFGDFGYFEFEGANLGYVLSLLNTPNVKI